jgi:membrane protein implicated in regulation of membrane protease activity
MSEFLTEITNASNILPTGLLGLVALYWLLVIFGAVGIDALDIDADMDGEPDLDLADGVLGTMFAFFHVGQVPLMLVVSFFSLFFWISMVCVNHYLNPEFNLMWTALWLFPCGIVSLLLTKPCVAPIARIFRSNEKPMDRTELIGQTAVVHTLKLDQKYGEIIFDTKGSTMVLNARNESGQTLQKGDVVMIVAHDLEKDVCLVELAKLESN